MGKKDIQSAFNLEIDPFIHGPADTGSPVKSLAEKIETTKKEFHYFAMHWESFNSNCYNHKCTTTEQNPYEDRRYFTTPDQILGPGPAWLHIFIHIYKHGIFIWIQSAIKLCFIKMAIENIKNHEIFYANKTLSAILLVGWLNSMFLAPRSFSCVNTCNGQRTT